MYTTEGTRELTDNVDANSDAAGPNSGKTGPFAPCENVGQALKPPPFGLSNPGQPDEVFSSRVLAWNFPHPPKKKCEIAQLGETELEVSIFKFFFVYFFY